ncbi:MAG: HK97 family phage prohead protease [Rickettsiaceae bacterium]|nr:HK97 family phage prohead protease [Rickettsiaceae bacterium]
MNKSGTSGLVVKSATSDYVIIGGYASVFGVVDSHNDIVVKGAFQGLCSAENIKLLWQHDTAKPIGLITSAIEDDYGLYVEATINISTQQGREAFSLIKQGAVTSFSIGFTVEKANHNASGTREILSAKLWEVSIVTFPANSHAQINHIGASKNISLTLERAVKILDSLISTI